MNRVFLCGRLVRDPDVRTTQSGMSVARMTLAVDRRVQKEGQPSADFPGIVAWDKTADFAGQYLSKGLRILVEGRLQTGSYEKDGVKHYTTDVIAERIEFADGKRDENADGRSERTPAKAQDGGEYDIPIDVPF